MKRGNHKVVFLKINLIQYYKYKYINTYVIHNSYLSYSINSLIMFY